MMKYTSIISLLTAIRIPTIAHPSSSTNAFCDKILQMAALKVLTVPDPVLRNRSVRVPEVDRSITRLIKDMIETMQLEGGVGLAAPQIGKNIRLIVLHMPDEEPFGLVNPEITKREGDREILEACLSIPGYEGLVHRSVTVTAKGIDHNGKHLRIKASGLLAQALEHEIDHLDGILYPDHIEDDNKLFVIDCASDQISSRGNIDTQ
ncbi:MAG: peptide deformylase [Dehalococcoidales bacterium]|nr:peptide deformylase [Dehalococcoidales bacterium]MDD4323049.1 peptide deformylase [Dehalococcoidales bacterium]MDD4794529.1 peptide deformylase [Dehalococcoidales bacterium]MDD5498668.1 peptide deformylase [Dehalococcoidales bacterium]